jgi:Fe-S-cluster containining protein
LPHGTGGPASASAAPWVFRLGLNVRDAVEVLDQAPPDPQIAVGIAAEPVPFRHKGGLAFASNESIHSAWFSLHSIDGAMGALKPRFSFKLRKEVQLDAAALHDPLTGAAYPLSGTARSVVEAIDAQLGVEEQLAKIEHAGGIRRAQAERELRQLMLLGFFEDTCSGVRERIRRIREGERLRPLVLEGSRFGCRSSGACCRGYVFGPISSEEKLRIEALDPRRALPHLGVKPLFTEAGLSSGKPAYRLATAGDACIFLDTDCQCGLHRAFGPDAKPTLCRLYPLAVVATIDGLKIYDRGECASFAVSAHTGELLDDAIPRVRALADEEIYHPVAWVHETWRCDYGLILALGRRLGEEASSSPPLRALHAIGHVVRGYIETLTRCPFERGEPEAAMEAALGRPTAHFRPPEEAVAKNALVGLSRLAKLAEALGERVAPAEPHASLFIESASLLSQLCHGLLNGPPMPPRAQAAAEIAIDSHAEKSLTLSLRQQIFGRELLLDDQLPAGLLRMAFVIAMTLAGARLRALDEGQKRVSPRHLSASHMIIKRTLHRPEPHGLLRANGEQAWPILDALALLDREFGSSGNG